MLKFKKLCTVFLAVGTAVTMGFPTLAAQPLYRGREESARQSGDIWSENPPGPEEEEEYGATTVSIFSASQPLSQVSFTVPLTVSMVVEEGSSNVHVPQSGYMITNTSETGPASSNIAVVRMIVTKMAGSAYNTVEGPEVTGAKDILFKVGNVTMPALSTPHESKNVTLRAEDSQFLEKPGPGDYAKSNWKKIPAKSTLALNLEGTVSATVGRSDQDMTNAFEIQYILSPLDQDGHPLGQVYAGDSHTQAGLNEYHP